MLPERAIELFEGCVRAFDAERQPALEFLRIRNQEKASRAQQGLGWGSSAIIAVGKSVTSLLEERARFLRDKSQEVVTATGVEPYAELSTHLKAQIAACFIPARQVAERFMEDLRRSANAPSKYTIDARAAFPWILPRIDAEVDLFCAAYATRKEHKAPAARYSTSRNSRAFSAMSTTPT